MRITCNASDVRRALSFVSQGIVGRSSILDELLRVVLTTEENGLRLAMGSAKLCSTYCIDARVEEPGALSVSTQALSAWLCRDDADRTGMEQVTGQELCEVSSQPTVDKEGQLTVTFTQGGTCATTEGTLASMEPQSQKAEGTGSFALSAHLLSEMIAQVLFAASEDEYVSVHDRVYLTVWLHLPGDGTLTLAACDQKQLALRRVSAPGALLPYGTLQIPAQSLATLSVLLAQASDEEDGTLVQILPEVQQTQVHFLLTRGEVALQLAVTGLLPWERAASFAPFETFIPKTISARHSTRFILATERLRSALRSARGLVRCSQRTGADGQDQLYLEIYSKGNEKVKTASVPILRWSGLRGESTWFDATLLMRALASPGTASTVVLDLGKTASSPVVLRWVHGRAISKDYAYAFAVNDPYLALLSTRKQHTLSALGQYFTERSLEHFAGRRDRMEHRLLRDAVLREIVRMLDCGLAPFRDDVMRIAKSARTQKLLAKESLEQLSFGRKRAHQQKLASVCELIAILAFAEGGYEVPIFGIRIEAEEVQKTYLAMQELGI